jgi:hypothetical protein
MNQNSNVTRSPGTQEATSGKKQAILDEAKDAMSHVADQARDQVSTRIGSQKDKAADTIGSIAAAIRQTGDKLRDSGPLPDIADRAADGVERVANYFQTRNVGEIVREVERFARREPAIFLGTAFTLGLLGGRFLKSSSRRGSQTGDASQTWDARRDSRDYGGYARGYEEHDTARREDREASARFAAPAPFPREQTDTSGVQRAPSASPWGTVGKSSPSGASFAGTPSTSGAVTAGYCVTPGSMEQAGGTPSSAGTSSGGSGSITIPGGSTDTTSNRSGGSGRV